MSDVKEEIVNNDVSNKHDKKMKNKRTRLMNRGEILTNVFRSDEEKNWNYLLESAEAKEKKKQEN